VLPDTAAWRDACVEVRFAMSDLYRRCADGGVGAPFAPPRVIGRVSAGIDATVFRSSVDSAVLLDRRPGRVALYVRGVLAAGAEGVAEHGGAALARAYAAIERAVELVEDASPHGAHEDDAIGAAAVALAAEFTWAQEHAAAHPVTRVVGIELTRGRVAVAAVICAMLVAAVATLGGSVLPLAAALVASSADAAATASAAVASVVPMADVAALAIDAPRWDWAWGAALAAAVLAALVLQRVLVCLAHRVITFVRRSSALDLVCAVLALSAVYLAVPMAQGPTGAHGLVQPSARTVTSLRFAHRCVHRMPTPMAVRTTFLMNQLTAREISFVVNPSAPPSGVVDGWFASGAGAGADSDGALLIAAQPGGETVADSGAFKHVLAAANVGRRGVPGTRRVNHISVDTANGPVTPPYAQDWTLHNNFFCVGSIH
jgi:hypothetical protein